MEKVLDVLRGLCGGRGLTLISMLIGNLEGEEQEGLIKRGFHNENLPIKTLKRVCSL